MRKTFDPNYLDIITPVKMEADWPTAEELVETLRFQKQEFGIRRFALGAPSIGWKTVGFPPLSHFEKLAELFVRVRDAVREDGISCGYLNMLTLRNGSGEGFGKFICVDGSVSEVASCPLDPVFQKAFAQSNARFAAIAHPDFIIMEDEYSVDAQNWGGLGCFCPHHLREFSRRCGRDYSREELAEALREKTPEGLALLRSWRQLARDSLVELASAVRREVDRLTPEIPIGTMQSCSVDRDGDSTEAVARAFAGPNHTPFSRIFGAVYCDLTNGTNIPENLYHTLYSRQHISGDFLFYYEADTYPHTRYFLSARKNRAIMANAFSMGFDGATHQTVQILDDKNEDTAYGQMYREEAARYNAVSRVAKQCTVRGVEIGYDPFWNTVDTPGRPVWVRAAALLGIPFATLDAEVAFWDRRQAKYLDDEAVLRRLGRGLILDAEAAQILVQRGFGRYIGVEVGGDLMQGPLKHDDAAREVIRPPFDRLSKGKHMWTGNQCAANRGGRIMELRLLDPRAEIVTELWNFRQEPVCPGMVRFENDLGGRIVVLGQTMQKNVSGSMFNHRRQRLLQEMVRWCGDGWVLAENEPNIFVVMNEAASPDAGFIGMLTLTNLGDDPAEKVVLHLPPRWREAACFKVLNREGRWEPIQWERREDGLAVGVALNCCDPIYILAE